MGSKPWRTLSALVALSVLTFGCTNGPQKDKSIGATYGNPPLKNAQTAQTPPPLSKQTLLTGQQKPVVPPFNTSSPINQTGFQPSGQLPANQGFPPTTTPAFRPTTATPPANDGLPFSPNLPPIQQPFNPAAVPNGPLPGGFNGSPPAPMNPGFATDRPPVAAPANFPR